MFVFIKMLVGLKLKIYERRNIFILIVISGACSYVHVNLHTLKDVTFNISVIR